MLYFRRKAVKVVDWCTSNEMSGCAGNAVDLVIMSPFAVAVCWQRIIVLLYCHLVAARMVQTEFCSTISATMPKSRHPRVPWVQCRALPNAIERLEGR